MGVLTKAPERRANVLRHGAERFGLSMQHESINWRPVPGSQNAAARLTTEQVAQIRASQETLTVLAARFGVGTSTIHRVRRNQTWTGVIA